MQVLQSFCLRMTSTRLVRRFAAAIVLTLTSAIACSSPTSPSRTPVAPVPAPQPPLAITCPSNQTAHSAGSNPIVVSFPVPVVTGGSAGGGAPAGTISCTPSSGAVFPVGTTEVRCTATASTQTASCSFTVTVTAPVPRLTRTRFLAFGDSMTAGEVTQPAAAPLREDAPNFRFVIVPSASYPTRLLTLLRGRFTAQTAQIEVTNAGRPGEWAQDGALRLPGVMSANRPEAVLLMHGVNDLTALGDAGMLRAALALDTMAKEVRGRGARLFMATLPPSRPGLPNAVPLAVIQALNSRIRTTAAGEGAVLVDVHQALSANPAAFIGPDGIHPTIAGYERIAEAFFAALRADLEARPQ